MIAAFAIAGPLRPGWSHRAGTSSALLAQLSGAATTSYSGAATSTTPSDVTRPPAAGIPSAPFNTSVSGTVATSPPDASGDSDVTLTLRPGRLLDAPRDPDHRTSRERGRRHAPERRDLRSVQRPGHRTRRIEHRRRGIGSVRLTHTRPWTSRSTPAASTLTGQVSGSPATKSLATAEPRHGSHRSTESDCCTA